MWSTCSSGICSQSSKDGELLPKSASGCNKASNNSDTVLLERPSSPYENVKCMYQTKLIILQKGIHTKILKYLKFSATFIKTLLLKVLSNLAGLLDIRAYHWDEDAEIHRLTFLNILVYFQLTCMTMQLLKGHYLI